MKCSLYSTNYLEMADKPIICNNDSKYLITDSDLLIPKSLQPDVVDLIYFNLSNNLKLKYQRFTLLVCKNLGIRKFELVAKTQNSLKF